MLGVLLRPLRLRGLVAPLMLGILLGPQCLHVHLCGLSHLLVVGVVVVVVVVVVEVVVVVLVVDFLLVVL